MSMTDPIADMLTRIRNGLKAEKISVDVPASKTKMAIVNVLKDEGYINDAVEKTVDGKSVIEVGLKYYDGKPVIEKMERVSRPGCRIYRSKDDLPSVVGGLGVAIISTSRGVMTEKSARDSGVGGEVMCTVY